MAKSSLLKCRKQSAQSATRSLPRPLPGGARITSWGEHIAKHAREGGAAAQKTAEYLIQKSHVSLPWLVAVACRIGRAILRGAVDFTFELFRSTPRHIAHCLLHIFDDFAEGGANFTGG
jgi:hypothetical protein